MSEFKHDNQVLLAFHCWASCWLILKLLCTSGLFVRVFGLDWRSRPGSHVVQKTCENRLSPRGCCCELQIFLCLVYRRPTISLCVIDLRTGYAERSSDYAVRPIQIVVRSSGVSLTPWKCVNLQSVSQVHQNLSFLENLSFTISKLRNERGFTCRNMLRQFLKHGAFRHDKQPKQIAYATMWPHYGHETSCKQSIIQKNCLD